MVVRPVEGQGGGPGQGHRGLVAGGGIPQLAVGDLVGIDLGAEAVFEHQLEVIAPLGTTGILAVDDFDAAQRIDRSQVHFQPLVGCVLRMREGSDVAVHEVGPSIYLIIQIYGRRRHCLSQGHVAAVVDDP